MLKLEEIKELQSLLRDYHQEAVSAQGNDMFGLWQGVPEQIKKMRLRLEQEEVLLRKAAMGEDTLSHFNTHDWIIEAIAATSRSNIKATRLKCRRCRIYYSFMDRLDGKIFEGYGTKQVIFHKLQEPLICNEGA